MLSQFLANEKVRFWVYLVFAAVGTALGATEVGFAAAEIARPVWLDVATPVYAFLGTAFGYTAATHVESPLAPLPKSALDNYANPPYVSDDEAGL